MLNRLLVVLWGLAIICGLYLLIQIFMAWFGLGVAVVLVFAVGGIGIIKQRQWEEENPNAKKW